MQVSFDTSTSAPQLIEPKLEAPSIKRLSVWMQEVIAYLVRTGQNLKAASLQSRATWDKNHQDSTAWQIFQKRLAGATHLAGIASAKFNWIGHVTSATDIWLKSNAESFQVQGDLIKDKLQRVSSVISSEESALEKLISLLQQVIQAEKLAP
jgi:hypothetical protein